jgi:aldehyde dehydrogenase (NAD+)
MVIDKANILEKVKAQRKFFSTGKTKSYAFRRQQLEKLLAIVQNNEQKIYEALWKDLHKPEAEVFLTEISVVITEIKYHLKNLRSWMKPERVATPYYLLPSSSYLYKEPFGCTLIVAPWNYPFQLMINPLVGAISAGNCSILRPSPFTPSVSALMAEMIAATFEEGYITLIEGSKEENEILMQEPFDFIFFTGSPGFGKAIMKAAAEHLTPVVLELGGKSPCIVDKDADIEAAARRIVWGKLVNAGQTCIAPDYVLVHASLKPALIEAAIRYIERFYGQDPQSSPDYPRIVHQGALRRLLTYLEGAKVVYGGKFDLEDRYLSPTLVDEVQGDDLIMRDEIFGPVLPLLSFDKIEKAVQFVTDRPKPLALYYFGSQNKDYVVGNTSSGGVCINDVIMHIANHKLPFGGVGNSGMGKYHGKNSFDCFSHQRAVMKTQTWFDIPMKFAPYGNIALLKKLLG